MDEEFTNSIIRRKDDYNPLYDLDDERLNDAYDNIDKIKEAFPDGEHKKYQWYMDDDDYYYTKGELLNSLMSGDEKKAEQIVENNPESADILPENSPLRKEAEQIGDGDKRTDEVNDDAIKEQIGLTFLQNFDPYDKVADQSWVNNPDYDIEASAADYEKYKGQGAPGVLIHRDDDFAGPDELPAVIQHEAEQTDEAEQTEEAEQTDEAEQTEEAVEQTEEAEESNGIGISDKSKRLPGITETQSVADNEEQEKNSSSSSQAQSDKTAPEADGASMQSFHADAEKNLEQNNHEGKSSLSYSNGEADEKQELIEAREANHNTNTGIGSSLFKVKSLLGNGGHIKSHKARMPSGEAKESIQSNIDTEKLLDAQIEQVKQKILNSHADPSSFKAGGRAITVNDGEVLIDNEPIEKAAKKDPAIIDEIGQ